MYIERGRKVAEIGDKIKAKFITVEIKEILEQEWFKFDDFGNPDYWNITFRDTNGYTRNWKSQYDGGVLIDKNA